MANRTFYCRYCEQGHLSYSLAPIDHERCKTCGSSWVMVCPSCQTKLTAFFSSEVNWSDENDPVKKPRTPERCENCGAPFPWAKKAQTEKKEPSRSQPGGVGRFFQWLPFRKR